jgi:hypothetical protein
MMDNANKDSTGRPWPMWWWPSAMMEPWNPGAAAGAPQSLNQPILPGWTFGNSINITENNSGSPETERDIVAEESYGRQLGRVLDALDVLIHERPKGSSKPKALSDLLDLRERIETVKLRSATSRVKHIESDLARLKKDDPKEYRRVVAALTAEVKSSS